MTTRSLLAALLLTASVVVQSCQRAENRDLKRLVRSDELIGKWVMTPGSVQDLKDVGVSGPIDSSRHTITIRADGTCHLHTFLSTVPPTGPLIDSPCRWQLRDILGRQELAVDVSTPSARTNYSLMDQDGALVVWQYADDPDSWRYVEYRKQ